MFIIITFSVQPVSISVDMIDEKIGTHSVHVASLMCQNCKNVLVLQDICSQ